MGAGTPVPICSEILRRVEIQPLAKEDSAGCRNNTRQETARENRVEILLGICISTSVREPSGTPVPGKRESNFVMLLAPSMDPLGQGICAPLCKYIWPNISLGCVIKQIIAKHFPHLPRSLL